MFLLILTLFLALNLQTSYIMQASMYAVNGSASSLTVGFEFTKRLRVLAPGGLGRGLRNRNRVLLSSLRENGCMSNRSSCFGFWSSDSVSMGTELVRTTFRGSRSVKAVASGELIVLILIFFLRFILVRNFSFLVAVI